MPLEAIDIAAFEKYNNDLVELLERIDVGKMTEVQYNEL